MLPSIVPMLMALAALLGVAEQTWPSTAGVLVGVQGGPDVLSLVRPLLGWDILGRRIDLSNYTVEVLAKETISGRRLQAQCSAYDQQRVTDTYNNQCKNMCGFRPSQVNVAGCTYTVWGVCSCSASCVCGVDARAVAIIIAENLVWVLIQFLIAACLWGSIREAGQTDPMPMLGDGAGFESGIFSCCDDGNTCCCGFCCPVIRASQTLYAANIKGFWFAMVIYSVGFIFPLLVGWQIIFFLLRFCYRMELRRKAGLQPNCCDDFCCTFWCGPCTICQEARHMEKALAAKSGSGPVGGPVAVGQVVGMPVQGMVVQPNQS